MRFFTIRLKYVALAAAFVLLLALGAFTAKAAGADEVYWSGPRSLPVY